MQKFILTLSLIISLKGISQELYVFSEPASNMPAHSVSAKLSYHYTNNRTLYNRNGQRLMPEIMFGFSKKLMVHVSGTFANLNTPTFRPESVSAYVKYRFLSNDDVHKHFRMAAFIDGSYTNVPFHFDEINLMGDKSGVEAGIIATQLTNKFAFSGTLSHTQLFHESRKNDVIYLPPRNYQSINYTLSAGYLLLPREYKSYKQLNLNLYLEVLGQQALDNGQYYIDLAPAIQLIFNSNSKLNIGHRIEQGSNMRRMMETSWLISFERTFLNALKKR